MTGRLTFLLTSPRVAPGLLSKDAWAAVAAADAVYAVDPAAPVAQALSETGVAILEAPTGDLTSVARHLLDVAADQQVIWLGSADADPGLSDAITTEVGTRHTAPEIEILVGSWDVQGARLLDAVAVMDRLRSPGGCPWDAQQTHESLIRYAREEVEELAEAIEHGADREHIAEELGDVLLQVLFHARIAQDAADQAFDIDTVAGMLVEKLVRRHPHVFADADASTPQEVEAQWARIKAEEKAGGRARRDPRP